jgi:lycopene beta-cyclase
VSFDVVLAGGGLASGLTALALRRRWPALRIAVIEAGPTLGGNHTWSCFGTDLDPASAALLEPLVVRRWDSVAVAFPGYTRRLETPYVTVSTERFATVVGAALDRPGSALLLGARITKLDPEAVGTSDGRRFQATLVLDGRGPAAGERRVAGYQKFLGLEVELDARGEGWPEQAGGAALVMDATVAQADGFRFVYVLPFGPRRLLVEDTTYADGPALDRTRLREGILGYLGERGLRVAAVLREEEGVLPLPGRGAPVHTPAAIGYRGGWFHPTTGYSLPVAARVAVAIAALDRWADAPAELARLAPAHRAQARFCERLNELMFRAVPGAGRRDIFERFYRLPRPTIERFYALGTSRWDRARLLCGRPPRGLSWRAVLTAAPASPAAPASSSEVA